MSDRSSPKDDALWRRPSPFTDELASVHEVRGVDLDNDGRVDANERSAGRVTDWGDVADRISERIAESPTWPTLNAALVTAAARHGYDVAADLPQVAARAPLPIHDPAGELYRRLLTVDAVDGGPAQPPLRDRLPHGRTAHRGAAPAELVATTTPPNDGHDLPSSAALEQIVRWAVADAWSGRNASACTAIAVHAAIEGSREPFRAAVADRAEHDGPCSRAEALHKILSGNLDVALRALVDNDGLAALLRTVAQQAGGHDVAEIATPNGWRLRAEHTGEAGEYQTAVLVRDDLGRIHVLASGMVAAVDAADALRAAAKRENALRGLDSADMDLVDQQLDRLHQLTAGASAAPVRTNPQAPDRQGSAGRQTRHGVGVSTCGTSRMRSPSA